MIELKDITDLKLAIYAGIGKDAKSFRNWKKLENDNFIPTTGKHNLYKGVKLYMYLNAYKEINKEECEVYNNMEILFSAFEALESNLNIDTSNLNEEVKQAILNTNKTALKSIKEILEDIRSI